MAQSQNTVHEIVLGTAVASETTLQAFEDTASSGEVGIFTKDGTAIAAGKDFVFAQKLADGMFVTDIVNPDQIIYERATQDEAEVQKVVAIDDFEVPGTAGDKFEYIASIRLYNHGSYSVENFHHYHGQFILTQDSGVTKTAEDVVDALVTNFNQNLSKEPGATASTNPLFTFAKGFATQTLDVDTAPTADANATVTINGTDIVVALLDADTDEGAATKIAAAIDAEDDFSATAVGTVVTITADGGEPVSTTYDAGTTGTTVTIAGVASTAALTITAKAQTLELGKKEGRPLEFSVTSKVSKVGDEDFGIAQPTVATVTPADVGTGTGRQVALMEYFFRGNRGDHFRGVGYPYDWTKATKTLADPTAGYNLFTVSHYSDNNGFNSLKMPKQVTIAITEASSAGIDAIIGDYNTLTGKSVATFDE